MKNVFIFSIVLIIQLLLPSINADYNEDTAISLVHFAAASFIAPNDTNRDNLTQQCFTKAWPQGKWVIDHHYDIGHCSNEAQDTCRGLIVRNEQLKIAVFAFRGTVGVEQLWNEAKKSLENFTSFDVTTKNGNTITLGRVNVYFYQAMNDMWTAIEPYLTNYPGYKIMFTGHSLGGAIAALSALRARAEGLIDDQSIRLYTFGEPRAGDYALAESMLNENVAKISEMYRVIHFRDPVPHMPFCDRTDNGNGCKKTDGKPYQHPQEIWYHHNDQTMNPGTFKKCSKTVGEDETCSDGIDDIKFIVDTLDAKGSDFHNHYFNHRLDQWGPNGCNSSTFIQISSLLLIITVISKLFI